MTAIRSPFLPLVAVAASLVVPGCYTLLKHPTVDTAAYEEVQSNPCTSCHYEDELWYYHHASEHRLYPGSYADSWGYYYEMPWWYESSWHIAAPPGPSVGPPPIRPLSPAGDKSSTVGGSIGPQPDPKSAGGSVRFKHSDDDSVTGSKDTGGGKSDGDRPKTRNISPKTKKEKSKGKGEGNKTG